MAPRPKTAVILTHENADFDAIASLLGAWKLYPDATPVLPRRVNRNGRAFLAIYGGDLPMRRPDDLPRATIEHAILVDTQSLTTVKGMQRDLSVLIIDHHPLSRELSDNWKFRGETVGATTTLLVEQIAAAGLAVSPVEATLMLLGIYEDTGSLSYLTTTARDAHAAGWLLERGANLSVANEHLHHPLSPQQHALYDRLVKSAETHTINGQQVAIAVAPAESFDEELSTVAHKVRDRLEPEAMIVLVALDGHVQMIARSATDAIDVSTIASHFGGGGHTRAAAALIRDRPLESINEELLELLPQIVEPPVSVKQIMSRGVQTVQADTLVAEAADLIERTGHEGYPVLQENRIVGLLTRMSVDRAMRHRLGNRHVADIMEAGQHWVAPDDPVEAVQTLMSDYGWGQMPVVDEEQLIGIVTRTDLIKLWSTPPEPPSAQDEISQLLSRALSPATVALVRRISQTADQMGYSIYFVGGLVRDLLLDLPIVDIDIVVEGDAITLARRLRKQFGGRVRSHARFGTAKWLIERPSAKGLLEELFETDGERENSELATAIDFVTARTEFYTHPTALPEVERSSIKQDLHRRDFTINTLAIQLDPDHFGKLLDFYGGEADLEEGLIRVLHSLSFIEDPTRILRAARLETRLSFKIESRTEQLIGDAVEMLDRVSGDRIRHELELIFQEAEPERALCRLQELNVLEAISPGLICDRWLKVRFHRLREAVDDPVWSLDATQRVFGYLALALYRLAAEERKHCQQRLKLGREEAKRLAQIASIKEHLSLLREAQPPSMLFKTLASYSVETLLVVWAAEEKMVSQQIRHFQAELRDIHPLLDGSYIIERYGLRPSPVIGRLLDRLRDARLDGKVQTWEDENALLKELVNRLPDEGDGDT